MPFSLLQTWTSVRLGWRCVPGSASASTPSAATSASATRALTCSTSTGNTSAWVPSPAAFARFPANLTSNADDVCVEFTQSLIRLFILLSVVRGADRMKIVGSESTPSFAPVTYSSDIFPYFCVYS